MNRGKGIGRMLDWMRSFTKNDRRLVAWSAVALVAVWELSAFSAFWDETFGTVRVGTRHILLSCNEPGERFALGFRWRTYMNEFPSVRQKYKMVWIWSK